MIGFIGEYSFNADLSNKSCFRELLSLSKSKAVSYTEIINRKNYKFGVKFTKNFDKQSEFDKYNILLNGIIYNLKELTFKYGLENKLSYSNERIIIDLIEKLGIHNTIKELNGMFAIAIFDTEKNELYITRDFAGIKPLFYGISKKGFVFASQFDQIFLHPWFRVDKQLRIEIVKEYFAFGYMQAPNTIFDKIFQVNPGELIKINSEGAVVKELIVQFPREPTTSSDVNISNLKAIIKKSVKRQLDCNVAIGVFLSGGVDSSLITSYSKELDENIEAFTLKFDEDDLDESKFAKITAKQFKISHTLVEVKKVELVSIINEHFNAFSEPFGDFSSIPTYIITKKASQRYKSMLSGDGGDELFWGYPRMYDTLNKMWWFKIPLFIRKNLVRITNKLKITNTYAPFASSLEDFWMQKQIKLPSSLLNSSFNDDFSCEMKDLYRINISYNKKQLQQYLRWNEFYGHMQRVLVKVNQSALDNNLEVRIPLLDKDVIEASWKIYYPINSQSRLKEPLKILLYENIPKELLMKGKKGFSAPINSWLRNELRQDLINTILDSEIYGNPYFNQGFMKEYTTEFIDGKHNNGWGVWHIYAWQKWAAQYNLI